MVTHFLGKRMIFTKLFNTKNMSHDQNKLQGYSNNIVSIIERIVIYYLIITILAKLRTYKNWLYHICKWIVTIPLTFMMTIGVSLILTFIIVVFYVFLQLFVDMGNMPILLLKTLDINNIGEFYLHNFYITIPLIIFFHKNLSMASSVLAHNLYARSADEIDRVLNTNIFREITCFVLFFILPIFYWTFIR